MTPLLHLTEQTEDPDVLIHGLQYNSSTSLEIGQFVDSINDLLDTSKSQQSDGNSGDKNREDFANIINQMNNLSNGIINYAQLLKDTYREVNMGEEEIKIVEKIIESAEQIAALNKEI